MANVVYPGKLIVTPEYVAVPPAPMFAALDVAYEAMLRARVRTALAKKMAA